jgi:hypothetical protein
MLDAGLIKKRMAFLSGIQRSVSNIKDREIFKMSHWEPKIVSFLCNWCSYGAADLAGVSRMEYPPNIRVIRIPCTGRMSPKFILAAFRQGADGVWVSG